jgi:hypothetical protein
VAVVVAGLLNEVVVAAGREVVEGEEAAGFDVVVGGVAFAFCCSS